MYESGSFEELSFLRQEVRRLRRYLNALTPDVATLLRRRGFRVFRKEPSDDLLLPENEFIDEYYGMMQKYSFRLFLRDVIKHQDFFTLGSVTRYATARVTAGYLNYLMRINLVGTSEGGYFLRRHIKSFGETLEWFIAEVLRREFGAEAIWGVKFKRRVVGGDYDVLAKLDGLLLYVEVKSSPPKQIYDSEITAYLERVSDLSADISVFLMDTELRMKDKIVPMFEKALLEKDARPPGVERLEKELFQIQGRVFIINSKDNVARNMETVLNHYFRKQYEAG